MKIEKRIHRLSNSHGFSYIEVIVGLVILCLAIVPLSRLTKLSNKTSGMTTDLHQGVTHAEEVIELIISDWGATNEGRGYDWVITNWSGQPTPNPPSGLSGLVTLSSEIILNGVTYVEVTVTVSGVAQSDIYVKTLLPSPVS
ncbi:hypothetical protein BVY01_03035 [bacterium I07]|nr:hypothetical protein BVY01_03035 [bacterium I07]